MIYLRFFFTIIAFLWVCLMFCGLVYAIIVPPHNWEMVLGAMIPPIALFLGLAFIGHPFARWYPKKKSEKSPQ